MSATPSGLDTDTSRWLSIALAFAAGVLAGAVLLTAVPGIAGLGGPTAPTDPGPDPEDPPFSTSAGTGCFEGEGDYSPNAGWVHEVAVGTSYAVTLNATILHDSGTVVQGSVEPLGDGEYELAIQVVEATDDHGRECDTLDTTFGMGVSLPTDYESFVVTVDGEPVRRVENDAATTADLYPLPNPINTTG
jgi:hypothetical protein